MRVLLAPGSFPGDVSARDVARALAAGWSSRDGANEPSTLPLSDASCGLLEVVTEARGGTLVGVTVPGPLGERVPASVLHVAGWGTAGGTAVIDAGQAIGPHLVADRDREAAALNGSSAGVGVLLRAAVASGAGRIVIGLGPAAVHDAGAGALAGLVGAVPQATGRAGLEGGTGLAEFQPRDLTALAAAQTLLADRDLVVACAEQLPLQGLHGAGADLSRRHGVAPARAQELDRAIGRWTDLLERQAGATPSRRRGLALAGADGPRRLARRPRSGAAGGVAALLDVLGGRLLDGAAAVADLLGLSVAVGRSDLVITAAARLDADAVHGGVVATVGEAGLGSGVPVVVVAPRVELSRRELAQIGVVASYAIDPLPGPFGPAPGRVDTRSRLEAMGARLATTWAPREGRG